jgi:ribosomal 50S subunit-recycling heat shock protein
MRIDLALKHLCLVKSRSIVKHLCGDGAVTINDRPARPASIARSGDTVSIRFPHRTITLELLDVPEKQLSKTVAPTYYRTISDEPMRNDDDDFR